MIASSVCTARAGYAPAAVSPASMIASTPSSTALAASLTSARVGRASTVIDSSTWVATITGMPWRRARCVISFCTRGTRSSGISSPRSPRATITASHDVEDLVEVFERLRPFEFRDQRHVRGVRVGDQLARLTDVGGALHEAERDHVDAERQPEVQILDVLRRNRRRRQRDTRRVDPFVLADLAALDDGRLDPGAVGAVDTQLDAAVREQQPIAGPDRARESRERRGDVPGPAGEVAGLDRQAFARLHRESAVRLRASRCGSWDRRGPGAPRPRAGRVAPPRECGRTSPPATPACHGKN